MAAPPPFLLEMHQALLRRRPGGSYREFAERLHRHLAFDRLTLCAAEPGGVLRVLHALTGGSGTAEAIGRTLPLHGSLAGQVFREQRLLRIDDLEGDAALAALEDGERALRAGLRAGLLLPLSFSNSTDEAVGVGVLWSRRPRAFTAAHEALLAELQPALALSLRNDRLYLQAERRSLELGTLERLARATRAGLDPGEVVPASLDAALSLLGLSAGGVLLLRGEELELVVARNLPFSAADRVRLPLSGPEAEAAPCRAFRDGRAVHCPDLAGDPVLARLWGLSGGAPRRRTWLVAIPLWAGEARCGVVLACGEGAFVSTPEELERLATIGQWIGSPIAEAERRAAASAQAEEDRKRQQLESLASLAGGLAHDFNNTLGAVLLTGLLLRDAAQRDPAALCASPHLLHDLDTIVAAARRGAELAGQMLAFSRGAPLHLGPLDINEVVMAAARALAHQPGPWPVQAALADVPLIRGDRDQLLRALSNVVRNAIEAMPAGGVVRIETRLLQSGPAERWVRVTIRDQGPGIDAAVRSHLFEPFVTTKQSATGLGLAVAFGVVRAHGGAISVESDARGASFFIDLPVGDGLGGPARPDEGPRPPPSGPVLAPGARVLVVDDEPMLTRIATRVLRHHGYSVDPVGSGAEALARYNRAGSYDLVLLDSTMPGMSGREVLEELLRRDPAVRVLVMSGYSMDGGPRELLAQGARGFLAKPFTPEELIHSARAILEEDR